MHRYLKWRDALHSAPNAGAIHALMRDYLVTLGPLVGTLPPACQKALSLNDLDVQSAAVAMLHEEMTYQGSEEVRELLHEIAHTFASASVRITLLHRAPTPE